MTTYRYASSWPVDTMNPKDRFECSIYLDQVGGPAVQTDLEGVASDLIDIWKGPMGTFPGEMRVDVYQLPEPTGKPKASVVVGNGPWTLQAPGEIALCLSFAKDRHNKHQRGRIYTPVSIWPSVGFASGRPSQVLMQRVLDLYAKSNDSFPDLGGIDWKFGIWSHQLQTFYQAEYAWVDDEWDTQRRRGRKPLTRLESVREG